MQFNIHKNLEGLHAPFSASQSSWLRYDDDKVIEVYKNKMAARMGTELHEWARKTIELGIKQPRSKKTLYSYVNDAIGFKMKPEVVLKYSNKFFGTADAICFRNNILRIHDLKTGKTPVHIEQLLVYAALFCLEYKREINFDALEIELRIYQNDEIIHHEPTMEEILPIMDKIVRLNSLLETLELEEV